MLEVTDYRRLLCWCHFKVQTKVAQGQGRKRKTNLELKYDKAVESGKYRLRTVGSHKGVALIFHSCYNKYPQTKL